MDQIRTVQRILEDDPPVSLASEHLGDLSVVPITRWPEGHRPPVWVWLYTRSGKLVEAPGEVALSTDRGAGVIVEFPKPRYATYKVLVFNGAIRERRERLGYGPAR